MYKTVRHGENSLQYTILPQTEEVLNNSGLKGKGRDYSPSIHVRHSRKRSSVKYILLVIFGIIVALALASVPLYVMNGALHARRSQQERNEGSASSPRPPTGREIGKSRKKELNVLPELLSTVISKLETTTITPSSSTGSTTVPTSVASERATTPPWTMPALRSWKSSTSHTTIPPIPTEDDEIPLIGTPSGGIRLLDHYISMKPWEKDVATLQPTVTLETKTLRNMFRYYSRSFVPSVKTGTDPPKVSVSAAVTTTTTAKATATHPATTDWPSTSERSRLSELKDALLSVDDDDDFKESLEVDEVFSLPPLQPEPPADDVAVAKAAGAWYGARWPFVDTSSYFQWTGYSPGDNLLLPLLVAALSSVALVLLLALALRRRKRTLAPASHIGLTADLQADDNTNLLTAENPEDAEE